MIACLSSARLQQGGHRLLRRKQAIAISSNLVAKEKALSVADLGVAVSSYETKDNLFSRADVVCQEAIITLVLAPRISEGLSLTRPQALFAAQPQFGALSREGSAVAAGSRNCPLLPVLPHNSLSSFSLFLDEEERCFFQQMWPPLSNRRLVSCNLLFALSEERGEERRVIFTSRWRGRMVEKRITGERYHPWNPAVFCRKLKPR